MAMTSEAGKPAFIQRSQAFWLILALLTIYVAFCTPHRDNNVITDDWEHHRAVLALSKNLWKPGNPTFATEEPSIRYSPYSLALALLVRTGLVDAYQALSWAGVVNTVLLGIGLRLFLASYGRRDLAATALVVMVSLWGMAPMYANSYALADLPIHQVNPSAFAWALTLMMWAWFRRLADSGLHALALVCISLLSSLAMLSHGMTGAAGALGLGVVALAAPPERRRSLLIGVVLVGIVTLAICSAWPWYDFLTAIRGSKEDNDYWFNPFILWGALTVWTAPALVLALFALPLRSHELIRVGYFGAALFFALGVSSIVTKSPLTARFPMIGIFFLHVLVAAYLDDSAFFRLGSWPGRIRALLDPSYSQAGRPMLDIVVGLLLAYCLAPQLWSIVREPGLARAYFAPLLKFENKQHHLKPRYDSLLADVADHDVVLSDGTTSWPVPSTSGRIVVANHLEFFTKGQKQRKLDVEEFFAPNTSEAQRLSILQRYNVRWILLSRKQLPPAVYAELIRPKAVVKSDNDLTLMDAKLWEQSR